MVWMVQRHFEWYYHSGWTPFYFMYDPKCSTTFPWCTINAPAAFAWCTINVPAAFARCTNRFVHKVEFSHIGWNGVHPLWLWPLYWLYIMSHELRTWFMHCFFLWWLGVTLFYPHPSGLLHWHGTITWWESGKQSWGIWRDKSHTYVRRRTSNE